MPRPTRVKQVSNVPSVTYFKPAGIPVRCLEEVVLTLEEAEAIRLKDMEGLEQEHGAEKMMVSRPTFQRVLASARRKLADALLTGKAIRIEGGHFKMSPGRFRCQSGHEWEVPFESMVKGPPHSCPVCGVTVIEQLSPKGSDCPVKKDLSCCRQCSRTAARTSNQVGTTV